MRFKSFKIGITKEKPDGDTAGAGETPAAQIAETEEPLNNKTKDLEVTEPQLKELADTANDPKEDEETPPQPHGPLGELSVEPGDDLTYDDTDIGTLLENADEEVKVVKVGAGADAPAEAEKEPTKEDESDSLSNLFSDEEEEENPLANLINSLPDVTTQELLDDLEEIQGIISEQQR